MKDTKQRFHSLSVFWGICLCLLSGCGAPPELPVLVEEGWTAYQARDTETLNDVMTKAIKRDKRSVEVRFLRGLYLIRSGSPQASLVPLRDAARTESLRPRAALAAAQAYYDLGQFQAVQQVLNDVLQQQPENIDAHRLLAALNYDLGINPRAIHHLETVARLDPQDPRPHRLIGLMRKDFQDYPAAVEAYRIALARDPQPGLAAEIRLELAQSLISQREYAAALEALTADDQSPDALTVRLQCFDSLNRRGEAAAIVKAAHALTEPPAELCLALGDFYESGGKPSEAIAAYEQAARIDPLDFIPRYKLSSAYARAGRDADARRELEAMQENRARYDQLHELQNQAMEKTEDADLRYRIGEAAAALGRQELAQAWYRAALGLDPTHAAAQARLSQAGGSTMPGNAAKPAPSAAAPSP
jgi:tetratricopeptide (TPR) repeat protein